LASPTPLLRTWDLIFNRISFGISVNAWANGQVEGTNGLILEGLKKRLYDKNSKKGGKWINEISSVIWGLRTQPSKATGQSPFFLLYGFEAILPADVMWKSPDWRCLKKARLTPQDISSSTHVTPNL
jgi:hypothetical protein